MGRLWRNQSVAVLEGSALEIMMPFKEGSQRLPRRRIMTYQMES